MRDLREIHGHEPKNLCGIAAAVIGSAVVGAGSSMIAGSSNASAAKSAAKAQQQGNAQAIAEQQREFNVNQGNLQPWLHGGQGALSRQMQLLGLGGIPGIGSNGQPQTPDYAAYVQNNPDLLASYQAQANGGDAWAPNGASGQSMEQFGQNHYQAYGSGGRTVTPFGQGGDAASQQQTAIDGLQSSPLYQSLYRNGQNAILANGAATGGLRGGNMQHSLANFGADTLSTVIQQHLANLSGVSGAGQNAGGTLGSLGANSSGNISNLLSQNGSAQAGGILSSAGFSTAGVNSALSQGLNGVGNYLGAQGYLGGGYQTGLPQYSGLGGDASMNGLF